MSLLKFNRCIFLLFILLSYFTFPSSVLSLDKPSPELKRLLSGITERHGDGAHSESDSEIIMPKIVNGVLTYLRDKEGILNVILKYKSLDNRKDIKKQKSDWKYTIQRGNVLQGLSAYEVGLNEYLVLLLSHGAHSQEVVVIKFPAEEVVHNLVSTWPVSLEFKDNPQTQENFLNITYFKNGEKMGDDQIPYLEVVKLQ